MFICLGVITDNVTKFVYIWNVDNLAGPMQNVGLALVTLLIPFAIALIVDILQKKNSPDTEFVDLDLHVILDHLFAFRRLIAALICLFVLPLFWDVTAPIIRILFLVVWAFSAFFMVMILRNLYLWTKGNVLKFRLEYVGKLETHDNLEVVWRSIWKAQNINTNNEGAYFSIFASKVDSLLINERNLPVIDKLLNDLGNYLSKRSLSFLTDEKGALPVILRWHLKSSLAEGARVRENQDPTAWHEYYRITYLLDTILKSIFERSLTGIEAYICFKIFGKHVATSSDTYYLNHFFNQICPIIFEKIRESPQRYDIWHAYYPAEWKVTKTILEDEHNLAAKIILNNFLQWTQHNLISPREEDYDLKLEEVARELFPETDPIEWARILIFVLAPRDPANVLKSVIESRWTFGHIGRVHVDSIREGIQVTIADERKKTIELALLLFADQLRKEKLEEYASELRQMKYEAESEHEHHRISLLMIFEGMLQYLARGSVSV
jgi:hypothetical protein